MTFPAEYTRIMRLMVVFALTTHVLYFFGDTPDYFPTGYLITEKLFILFTCFCSILNCKELMLRICNRGLLFEDDFDEFSVSINWWPYLVIGVIYNPIRPVVNSELFWLFMNLVVILYFFYLMKREKDFKEKANLKS